MTHQDIDKLNRVGDRKPYKNYARPIIVIRFLRCNVVKILKNKRKLKRKRISVTENLAKPRIKQFQKAREEYGFSNV